MANCLMQINQCGFPNCGQHFANQYDLTAHIEYTHIPMIEEETKRKAQLAAAAAASSAEGETPAVPVTNNLPLSYYSRVFRTAYRPNPIKPEPLKVSFNHYKKRALREKAPHPNTHIHKVYRDMLLSRGRNNGPSVSLEDIEKRLGDVDFDECGPENNEVRFRCHIVDCNKRYKNMFALRMHMKMLHSVVISEDAKSLTNFPSEDVKPSLSSLQLQPGQQQGSATPESSSGSQSAGIPTNPSGTPQPQVPPLPQFGNPATTPTSYKCTYCTKRYKTSSGLSNHMMASHQKISDAQDAPSPQVVEQLISQVRMQRQQQEANSLEQKNGQLTAQQQLANFFEGSSVRSYTVTTTPQPLRFNQQHYPVNLDNQPSTGQVLQMHMQQQRRIKQMQEQQAAAAAAAAAQQQQQQQQAQQMQPQGMPNQQGYAPAPQPVGSPMGPPMQQQPLPQLPGPAQQQQALPSLQPPSQQQYHQMPPPQQHQPNSSYPPQMHQMQSQHHYQQNAYPQQSPQFPPYQQQSPQGPPPPGPPQRSPIPLSQALPPLNSMTQRQQLPPIQPPNAVPMHLSPPNQQGYDMMTSPPSGQQMAPPPPPYNL